ncbi:unnamed protein product, partial [Anisakis simplex]|uniref:PAP-associated domain-containing protein n=1 Tax=Anisakis simplex TaxID=6269 RepID=A0A0M3K3J7_ANISI
DHEGPSENAFAGEGDRNCEWSINFNDDDRDYSDYAHSGQGVVLSNAWSSNYDNNIEKWRMKDDYLQVVNGLRLKLEDQLRMLYRHSCQLTVFGSLLNGFGISGSDIDASLTFVSFQRDDQPDSTAVITELTDVLPQIPEVTEVQPIPNARVPVVKFIYKDVLGCFQFDLSYDNKLAIENTSLLRAYNTVDKRVTQLGIMLKRWSEYCEIKDASCGRLSSYALCIMLIHFLQTTEPPVLPFLQQVCTYGFVELFH